MKYLIIIIMLVTAMLVGDTPKHSFTFTIVANEMTLDEASQLEKKLSWLLEDYENATLKTQMDAPTIYDGGFITPRFWYNTEYIKSLEGE